VAIEPVPELFVGDYQLIEEAGAGGFSTVWKARQGQELFALKFPQVEHFVEHLRQEALVGQVAADPQVVPVLEVNLHHDPPHLVMPWIAGADLPVPDEVSLPQIKEGLERARELAQILARLHARGVVHGDLKPSNVRLDDSGDLQLLDLGLGRIQVEANLERSLAQSLVSVDGRSLAGTLDYMAPELFSGVAPSSGTDAYALGVLLHHLLTGRPPAFGVSPRSINPYLPPGTEDLLRGLLHHDPRMRPELSLVDRILKGLIAQEARCLARESGHERRAIFRRRLGVLRRGVRALAVGLALPLALVASMVVLQEMGRLSEVESGPAAGLIMLVALCLLSLGSVGLLLGVTTLNAWLVGVPDGVYKHRPGHPVWNFMMQ
jgi:predicted Ser/Thr protein kinase